MATGLKLKNDVSVSKASAITASNTVKTAVGRKFVINCTVAGNVKVGFAADDSTLTIAVAVGTLMLDWSVNQVYVTGTTATATYANLS